MMINLVLIPVCPAIITTHSYAQGALVAFALDQFESIYIACFDYYYY